MLSLKNGYTKNKKTVKYSWKEGVCMPKKIEDLLKLYRAEVENVTEAKVKKVILYGSYARGDFRPDSDIDVMILVDTDRAGVSPLEKKICDVTYDFNDEHGTDIMPVVQSNTHFDYWKKADMFYRNVEKDGVVI